MFSNAIYYLVLKYSHHTLLQSYYIPYAVLSISMSYLFCN